LHTILAQLHYTSYISKLLLNYTVTMHHLINLGISPMTTAALQINNIISNQ